MERMEPFNIIIIKRNDNFIRLAFIPHVEIFFEYDTVVGNAFGPEIFPPSSLYFHELAG